MKKIILLGVLFCTWANAEDRLEQLESTISKNIYVYEDKGGTLLSSNYPDKTPDPIKYKRQIIKDEDGTFVIKEKNPIVSTYYADLNKWENAGCKVDRFDGKKTCEVRNDRLYVVNLSGKTSVMIIGADYPNKQSAIKIDENATIYGVEGLFDNDQKIINQLLKGKTAYVRYVEWPYSYNKDIEIDLSGFKEAYQEMKKEYASLK